MVAERHRPYCYYQKEKKAKRPIEVKEMQKHQAETEEGG